MHHSPKTIFNYPPTRELRDEDFPLNKRVLFLAPAHTNQDYAWTGQEVEFYMVATMHLSLIHI